MSSNVTDQRHAILASALQLLAEGGPQALRVRDIAAAAGCTTMTVYSRFGGKDGLIEAIYLDGFTRFTESLQDAAAAAIDLRAEALGMAYRTWALANPGSYQVMFTEVVPGFAPSDEAAFVALGSFQVLVDAIEALQAVGQISAGDPHEVAWALWGLTHGLVMLELAGIHPTEGPVDAEMIYRSALHGIVRGFAP